MWVEPSPVAALIEMTSKLATLDDLARLKDGSGHSVFSPSASPMWLACPGSLIPNLLEPDEGNDDSAYGTVAHSLTESWLKTGRAPEHLIGTTQTVDSFEILIDESMMYFVELAVDRCEWEPGEHIIERKVWFSHLTPIPRQGGTLDFAALRKNIGVFKDHKFGKSPDGMVIAEENPQLMLYAIGAMNDPDFTRYALHDFVIHITQPRLDHYDEWHTTRKRLIEFSQYVKERAAIAWQFDAPRVPGPKQCRYCKVRGSCSANAKYQEDLLNAVFQDESGESVDEFEARLKSDDFELRMSDIRSLTIEQKARLLPYRKMAEAWWAALQYDLESHAARGENVPGHKVVEGRSKRRFRNEHSAQKYLRELGLHYEDFIIEKMQTPASVEKLLAAKLKIKQMAARKLLGEHVYKPPGKASLVPLTDRRPAIEDLSSAVFEDESSNPESDEEL